ncbi:hypothetical protein DV515_00001527 [Chloebia gouldiae]|uniref:Uncharacterized protein n=1 Tax=Chloebia gouldiae TaxID=44316 RepID=A0A3L8SZS1_CHLGU|nr:hypothetical protein DV515_00001527 [Chloebia gouldiae]
MTQPPFSLKGFLSSGTPFTSGSSPDLSSMNNRCKRLNVYGTRLGGSQLGTGGALAPALPPGHGTAREAGWGRGRPRPGCEPRSSMLMAGIVYTTEARRE